MLEWNIFNRIYCIHYLSYKERYENIIQTLKDLNIYQRDNFQFYYTVKNKIFNYLFNILSDKKILFTLDEKTADNKIEGYIKNDKVFNLAINTYNLISEAYLLGYDRILIIEDDITPLKNKELLSNIISNIPLDYNIISMEYWFRRDYDKKTCYTQNRKINDYFYKIMNERIVNAGFIIYDKIGMRHFLDTMNQYFWNSDYSIANQKLWDDWSIKRCVSKVPIVIQKNNYEMNHVQNMKWNYNQIGVNVEDYEGY